MLLSAPIAVTRAGIGCDDCAGAHDRSLLTPVTGGPEPPPPPGNWLFTAKGPPGRSHPTSNNPAPTTATTPNLASHRPISSPHGCLKSTLSNCATNELCAACFRRISRSATECMPAATSGVESVSFCQAPVVADDGACW